MRSPFRIPTLLLNTISVSRSGTAGAGFCYPPPPPKKKKKKCMMNDLVSNEINKEQWNGINF